MEGLNGGESSRPDLHYWLALGRTPGVGAITFRRLLACVGSPQTLFELPASERRHLASLPPAAHAFLAAPDWGRVEADLRWAESAGRHILTLEDPRYPSLLKEIADPPPLLFVQGEPALLARPQIALVGSRNPTAGGRHLAEDFAAALSDVGLVVTSGLALGVDGAAHRGALRVAGKTLAVAGTGLDRVYPARHRDLARQVAEQGALVSEYAVGTPPLAPNFPRRNRIISGLSTGVLVVEAACRSGSLITARLAAEQGREVFALPGSIHNPLARGCHQLIREGAKLVESVDDILEELGPLAAVSRVMAQETLAATAASTEPVSAEQERLFTAMGYEPVSIDELVSRSGLTAHEVSSMLLSMELQGCVTASGGRYCRIETK